MVEIGYVDARNGDADIRGPLQWQDCEVVGSALTEELTVLALEEEVALPESFCLEGWEAVWFVCEHGRVIVGVI